MTAVSVYVHFPYCLSKCPYCDFASVGTSRGAIPESAYTNAVLQELDARWALVGDARVPTVFFGGGTPSLWPAESIRRVLAAICSRGGPPEEVTVECNPTSLDEAAAAALLEVGVTRLSIGVQSLREGQRRFLGRAGDGESALRALRAAKRAGFGEVNADLIYGLHGQIADALAEDVARVVETGVTHVSAYALTIEAGTPFGMLAQEGRLPIATDDDYAACHERLESELERAGFRHYEVSNYARAGHESRHNLHTWRGGDSLGIGAGAVSTLPPSAQEGRSRHRNVGDGARYIEAVPRLAHEKAPAIGDGVVVEREVLGTGALVGEAWMLGLRLAEGLSLSATASRLGRDPRLGRERAMERLSKSGDLIVDDEVARVPRSRWLVLDRIVRELI